MEKVVTLPLEAQKKIIKAYNDLIQKIISPKCADVVDYCIEIGLLVLGDNFKEWKIGNVQIIADDVHITVAIMTINNGVQPIHLSINMDSLNGDYKVWADDILKKIKEEEAENELLEKEKRKQHYLELKKEFDEPTNTDDSVVDSEPTA